MEVSLGAGYVHLGENKYDCYECDDFLGRSQKNYLGPTKAGLSLIFMIK
jgi:hypothetical protein